MKWLIVPTQTFSLGVKGKSKLTFEDLPWPVRLFLKVFGNNVHIILDEASWIKTNTAMAEKSKSSRCRNIKQLEQYSRSRCALTGTLMTKSPLNIVDPYQFLSSSWFKNEYMGDIADLYSVTMSLRNVRGRRVQISQKEWDKSRKRMINAYKFGGQRQLDYAISRLDKEIGLMREDCEHILAHRKFTPFKNVESLLKRVSSVTITVNRDDIFDTSFDRRVYDPIMRTFEIGEEGRRIASELIRVGFTDQYELGQAPALELLHRLKDVCNGFEPVQTDEFRIIEREDGSKEAKPVIRYEPFPVNPKLDVLEELLSDIDVESNQVVVWCSRRNALHSILERMEAISVPYVVYSGDQSDEEKKEAERKIRSGEARVFVGNPAAAAFGLNFLSRINYMVWYCVDQSVERYHQAQHRLLRGQSRSAKFAYMLCARGSVEERNVRGLATGVELLSASNKREVFEFS